MDTLVQILVPLLYFVLALGTMRYVTFLSRARGINGTDSVMSGLFIGFFWPVALPAWIVLTQGVISGAQADRQRLDEVERQRRAMISSRYDHD